MSSDDEVLSEPSGWDASDIMYIISDDDTSSVYSVDCNEVHSKVKLGREKTHYKTIVVEEKDFLPE